MTTKSRVPLNAILLSSSQFVRAAIGFLFFLYLARRLGPGDFGKYMFAFSLAEIFSILGDLGLHEYSIREMARRPELLRERLPGILVLKTLLSSTSAIIMVAILPLLGKDRATSIAVIAFALAQIGYSWFYASTIAFAARQDLHIQAFLWLMEKILFAAAGVVVIAATGNDFVLVAFSNTFVQFFGGALAVWIAWRKYGPWVLRLDTGKWKGYIRSALPFGLIVAFFLVYFRIDSVMISFFRSDEEVGQYGAAYNLVSALLFLPAGLVGAMFPRLAGLYKSPDDNLDAPFQRAARWLLAMSLPMAVGIWLLSTQLLTALLGDTYLPAATAFAILGWTLPVWFITFLQGNLLTLVERQKAVALVGLVNMILNVGLNLYIIPRYGFAGAAVTTLITEMMGLTQMFWLLKRNISLAQTLMNAVKVAALTVLMGALVWVLRDRINVFAVIAIASVAYISAIMATGIIPLSEIRDIVKRKEAAAEPAEVRPNEGL
ncbi:MAG: flippase [Thermoleophilia bacterium]|nr:flippase [Thermoleophilia bacterium]